ncbi:MAG: ATP-binding cassette domain-containing protein [Bacteroidetes bacterium]|nr:ATP-binding cassette domain-containing protein [Bacteroidota bacterium]
MKRFPHYPQYDAMDCGPSCLRMIAQYYGRHYSLAQLREYSYADREGVSLEGIIAAAERIGMRALPVQLPMQGTERDQLGLRDAPLPLIAHWDQNHFVVVYNMNRKHVWIADPAAGKRRLTRLAFETHWLSNGDQGIVLLLEPQPRFYEEEGEKATEKGGLPYLLAYLKPYRAYFWQLVLGLVLASLFQLLFPFLTQAIVDVGIQNSDLSFINLILLAQLMLFLGRVTVNILRNRILLHLGTRINVALIADFLQQLMRLPIAFFDTKMTGDLLQRIGDHRRIEQFLTHSSLSFLFSAFSLLVFGIVLWVYDGTVFLIFLISSLLYFGWIWWFLQRRQVVDNARFKDLSDNQSALIELVQGMPEIKLQNSSRKRRWQWLGIQNRLFRTNLKALDIEQAQDAGTSVISQLKDILITILTAKLVIYGEITLGMMLAVQFIIGQINVPLSQLAEFIRRWQDAKLSLARLMEVQQTAPEETEAEGDYQLDELPEQKDITIEGLGFQYNPLSEKVLGGIHLQIPQGKVTAIVGVSGSGKTTLVKLLLGFYPPTEGRITVGGRDLGSIRKSIWRAHCGAVLQDGFVFSDTIANNIAESSYRIDKERLREAVRLANLQDFVESLPLRYNTQIGAKGNGISQGQRQRLLIARAIYKQPDFLFLDEATNALDANNEREIVDRLEGFFAGRTVVVVAHRLSTVRQADQIVVLEQGRVAERGTHDELVQQKGAYYQLVKNQLELGQ